MMLFVIAGLAATRAVVSSFGPCQVRMPFGSSEDFVSPGLTTAAIGQKMKI
jgi:hypothetical protein